MINIFLCDDTPLQLRCIHDFVESYMANKPARIFDYNSPTDLLSGLSEHGADIAVLDISLGQVNGIDLAKTINAKCPNCQIIFLTAYPEYTSEAYFADHAWFILKKDMTKYLASALDKCLDTLEKGFYEAPAIWIRKRRNRERIPVSEILYLERTGHQTKVDKLHDTVLCRQTPEELLSTLERHAFIRCHQSFWVNTPKIFLLWAIPSISSTAAKFSSAAPTKKKPRGSLQRQSPEACLRSDRNTPEQYKSSLQSLKSLLSV